MAASSESNPSESTESWLAQMRPKLHRYCARMVGSSIGGEDVVQETLLKAHEALRQGAPVHNMNAWIFKIAFNACQDHLRRERLLASRYSEAIDELLESDELADKRVAVEASLFHFVALPSQQRASVILADVLGHSLVEIADSLGLTVPAVKASLHQGRKKLREQSLSMDAPVLEASAVQLVRSYADHFNARDFDALRAMLTADVEVELIGKHTMKAKEAAKYFGNYEKVQSIAVRPATIDGHTGILIFTGHISGAQLQHFATIHTRERAVCRIRDYRYAAYTVQDAEIRFL